MKYMFASDIHGSAYYCRKMLEAYEKDHVMIFQRIMHPSR